MIDVAFSPGRPVDDNQRASSSKQQMTMPIPTKPIMMSATIPSAI
jgi:hypothetical protein